jgi:methionyl-tRNA formyltransferase
MKVLYFGDPRGITHIYERLAMLNLPASLFELCGVVHGRRGGPGYFEMLQRIKPLQLPRWMRPDLNDDQIYEQIKALKPELLVSCFYPRAIPQRILSLAVGFNVHPSDLPQWRGPDPAYWIIRAGQIKSAISVHLLTEGLDEGDILRKKEVFVKARESGGALAIRLEASCALFLAEFVVDYLQNPTYDAKPQKGKVSWAPLIDPNDVEIDWQESATEIDRLVRAASPEPGAFTGIAGELAVIFSGAVVRNTEFDILEVGTPFIYQNQYHIKCGEDSYRIDWLRIGRKRISGKKLASLMGGQ